MSRDRSWDHARVLGVLTTAAVRCPDLRIGQLIVNALPPKYGNDAFSIEDQDLADALLAFSEKHGATR